MQKFGAGATVSDRREYDDRRLREAILAQKLRESKSARKPRSEVRIEESDLHLSSSAHPKKRSLSPSKSRQPAKDTMPPRPPVNRSEPVCPGDIVAYMRKKADERKRKERDANRELRNEDKRKREAIASIEERNKKLYKGKASAHHTTGNDLAFESGFPQNYAFQQRSFSERPRHEPPPEPRQEPRPPTRKPILSRPPPQPSQLSRPSPVKYHPMVTSPFFEDFVEEEDSFSISPFVTRGQSMILSSAVEPITMQDLQPSRGDRRQGDAYSPAENHVRRSLQDGRTLRDAVLQQKADEARMRQDVQRSTPMYTQQPPNVQGNVRQGDPSQDRLRSITANADLLAQRIEQLYSKIAPSHASTPHAPAAPTSQQSQVPQHLQRVDHRPPQGDSDPHFGAHLQRPDVPPSRGPSRDATPVQKNEVQIPRTPVFSASYGVSSPQKSTEYYVRLDPQAPEPSTTSQIPLYVERPHSDDFSSRHPVVDRVVDGVQQAPPRVQQKTSHVQFGAAQNDRGYYRDSEPSPHGAITSGRVGVGDRRMAFESRERNKVVHLAAVNIQRIFRGFRVRRALGKNSRPVRRVESVRKEESSTTPYRQENPQRTPHTAHFDTPKSVERPIYNDTSYVYGSHSDDSVSTPSSSEDPLFTRMRDGKSKRPHSTTPSSVMSSSERPRSRLPQDVMTSSTDDSHAPTSFVLEESKLADDSSLSLIEILPVRQWVDRTLGGDHLQRSFNQLSSLGASYGRRSRMTSEEQLKEPVSIVVGDKLSIVNLLAEKMLHVDRTPSLLSTELDVRRDDFKKSQEEVRREQVPMQKARVEEIVDDRHGNEISVQTEPEMSLSAQFALSNLPSAKLPARISQEFLPTPAPSSLTSTTQQDVLQTPTKISQEAVSASDDSFVETIRRRPSARPDPRSPSTTTPQRESAQALYDRMITEITTLDAYNESLLQLDALHSTRSINMAQQETGLLYSTFLHEKQMEAMRLSLSSQFKESKDASQKEIERLQEALKREEARRLEDEMERISKSIEAESERMRAQMESENEKIRLQLLSERQRQQDELLSLEEQLRETTKRQTELLSLDEKRRAKEREDEERRMMERIEQRRQVEELQRQLEEVRKSAEYQLSRKDSEINQQLMEQQRSMADKQRDIYEKQQAQLEQQRISAQMIAKQEQMESNMKMQQLQLKIDAMGEQFRKQELELQLKEQSIHEAALQRDRQQEEFRLQREKQHEDFVRAKLQMETELKQQEERLRQALIPPTPPPTRQTQIVRDIQIQTDTGDLSPMSPYGRPSGRRTYLSSSTLSSSDTSFTESDTDSEVERRRRRKDKRRAKTDKVRPSTTKKVETPEESESGSEDEVSEKEDPKIASKTKNQAAMTTAAVKKTEKSAATAPQPKQSATAAAPAAKPVSKPETPQPKQVEKIPAKKPTPSSSEIESTEESDEVSESYSESEKEDPKPVTKAPTVVKEETPIASEIEDEIETDDVSMDEVDARPVVEQKVAAPVVDATKQPSTSKVQTDDEIQTEDEVSSESGSEEEEEESSEESSSESEESESEEYSEEEEEEDDSKAKAEAQRVAAELEAKKVAEEAAEAKRKSEEAQKRVEAEQLAKAEAEKAAKAEADRIEAERIVKQQAEEREAKLRADAEEAARIKAEEDARAKAAEAARLKSEEEARARAAEAARVKAEEEAAAKAKAEEEATLARAAEAARLKAEEDERARAAEAARVKAEEAERARAAEAARVKAEEEAAAKAKAEEEAALARAAEAVRLKSEEETAARLREEESKAREVEEDDDEDDLRKSFDAMEEEFSNFGESDEEDDDVISKPESEIEEDYEEKFESDTSIVDEPDAPVVDEPVPAKKEEEEDLSAIIAKEILMEMLEESMIEGYRIQSIPVVERPLPIYTSHVDATTPNVDNTTPVPSTTSQVTSSVTSRDDSKPPRKPVRQKLKPAPNQRPPIIKSINHRTEGITKYVNEIIAASGLADFKMSEISDLCLLDAALFTEYENSLSLANNDGQKQLNRAIFDAMNEYMRDLIKKKPGPWKPSGRDVRPDVMLSEVINGQMVTWADKAFGMDSVRDLIKKNAQAEDEAFEETSEEYAISAQIADEIFEMLLMDTAESLDQLT